MTQNPKDGPDGSLTAYLSDMSRTGLFSRDEEAQAFRDLYDIEDEYLEHLVSHNQVAVLALEEAIREFSTREEQGSEAIPYLKPVLKYLKEDEGKKAGEALIRGARESDLVRKVQADIHRHGVTEWDDGIRRVDARHKRWADKAGRLRSRINEVKNRIANHNLRLVIMFAKKYWVMKGELSLSDLVQEGNFGLMKAIDKFDSSREVRFATYASWWIRQSVRRAISDTARTIRVPVHMADKRAKMARKNSRHMAMTGEAMSSADMAEEMGMSARSLADVDLAKMVMVSLDAPVGPDEEDVALVNCLADPDAEDGYERMSLLKLGDDLEKAMGRLTATENYIIRHRFGINTKPETLSDIAKTYGLTRERIRQIEARALWKLRETDEILRQYL